MGYAQDGAVCAVVFCRAYRPIGHTWTSWHALLGVADASVPLVSAAMFGLDAQLCIICVHQLFHTALLFLVLY